MYIFYPVINFNRCARLEANCLLYECVIVPVRTVFVLSRNELFSFIYVEHNVIKQTKCELDFKICECDCFAFVRVY